MHRTYILVWRTTLAFHPFNHDSSVTMIIPNGKSLRLSFKGNTPKKYSEHHCNKIAMEKVCATDCNSQNLAETGAEDRELGPADEEQKLEQQRQKHCSDAH